MSEFDYDLIVIGAGSGGTRTARISASYGAKTLVVEGDRAGGTCVFVVVCQKNYLFMHHNFLSKYLTQKASAGKLIILKVIGLIS